MHTHIDPQSVGTEHMDAISTKPVFYNAGLSSIVMQEIRIEENQFSQRRNAASILVCPGPRIVTICSVPIPSEGC